nr:MAG TPA: hypothetical protein [Caudoviricetes sp.]
MTTTPPPRESWCWGLIPAMARIVSRLSAGPGGTG